MFAVRREEQNLGALSSTTEVFLSSRRLLLLSIHYRSLTISIYNSEGRTEAQALPGLMLEVPSVHCELLQRSVLQPPFPSPSPSSTIACLTQSLSSLPLFGFRVDFLLLFFSTSSAGLCYGLSLYAVATPAPWRPTSSRLVVGMDNWIVSLECPGPRCPDWYACKILADMQSTRQVQCEVSCYPCLVWVSSSFFTSNRCEIGTVVHAAFVFSFLGFLVLCFIFPSLEFSAASRRSVNLYFLFLDMKMEIYQFLRGIYFMLCPWHPSSSFLRGGRSQYCFWLMPPMLCLHR